jgi:tetratricopeptide (TPR) repeat protein
MKKRFSLIYLKKYFPFEIVCFLFVTIAIYFGTLDHSFQFDDKENIWNNRFIQISNISISELKSAAFDSVNHDRPVANISFALNYYFHGLEVKGYHIVNIVVHLLAGIMLFYFVKTTLDIPLVRKKYGEPGVIPLFTSLIWLAHPLHIQSVTYIVQRMNSMAAMFFIMAMLFYVKGRLTPEKVKKVLFFAISFISGLLAVGTKQNTATLPLFILLYEWYFFQDLRLKFSRQQLFWIAAIGCLFVFVLYLFLGSSPLNRLFPNYDGRPFSMAERVLTQPRVVLYYISLIFYPEPGRLNLDYDFPLSHSLVSPLTTFLAILAIIGMLGLAIYSAKNNRLYSFCILWFFGNLVIESSTIPLEIIFEHRTYLPSMLVILLLVHFLYQAVQKKRVLIVFLVSISLLFSYWTYERNKVWKDDLTFWTDIYKKSPDKARVNQYYGKALYAAGRINEAFPIIEKALQLYEKQIGSQKIKISYELSTYNLNLGILYKDQGDYQKAIFYLNRSLNIFYYSTTAHYVIGLCYTQIGRYEEAINHLTKAMEFAKHSLTEIDGYSNVAKIEKSLQFAKMALKRQKDREYKLQKNLKR